MVKSRGLFDEQYRLEKLSKQKDPLDKLSSYLDFEYFRKPLKQFFDTSSDPCKGGRPAYDYVLMFKILILQRYYNLLIGTLFSSYYYICRCLRKLVSARAKTLNRNAGFG